MCIPRSEGVQKSLRRRNQHLNRTNQHLNGNKSKSLKTEIMSELKVGFNKTLFMSRV